MPNGGSQSSCSENNSTAISPIQNDGVANTTIAAAVMALSASVPARIPASAPNVMPIASASSIAVPVSSSVCGNRCAISSATGTCWR
jgi:hypothetical protein